MRRATRAKLRLLGCGFLVLACCPATGTAARGTPARPPLKSSAGSPLAQVWKALPEQAFEAGLDAYGPFLNDLSDSGATQALAVLDRAIARAGNGNPDARSLRAALVRERLSLGELRLRDRRPASYLPTQALLSVFSHPEHSMPQQLEWASQRLARAGRRLGQILLPHPPTSIFMVRNALFDATDSKRIVERIASMADTLVLAGDLQERMAQASGSASSMIVRYHDHLKNSIAPRAHGEGRPDTTGFARLLSEGYGFRESPRQLHDRVLGAARRYRHEMDSIAARLAPEQPPFVLLETLKGTHPVAEELIPTVTRAFRGAESFAARQWPSLPVAPLAINGMDFGHRIQGNVNSVVRPRPLRVDRDSLSYLVALVDPGWPPEVLEAFLGQNCLYFDSVLAARVSAPGEAVLWRLWRTQDGLRVWAAGTHTCLAWGYFAQGVVARAGGFRSRETELFERWSHLLPLARAVVDLELGMHVLEPESGAVQLSMLTGIDQRQCVSYVKEILDQPGFHAAVSLRSLELGRNYAELLAIGLQPEDALVKLAKTAVWLPADQRDALGLPQ